MFSPSLTGTIIILFRCLVKRAANVLQPIEFTKLNHLKILSHNNPGFNKDTGTVVT